VYSESKISGSRMVLYPEPILKPLNQDGQTVDAFWSSRYFHFWICRLFIFEFDSWINLKMLTVKDFYLWSLIYVYIKFDKRYLFFAKKLENAVNKISTVTC